MHAGHDNERHHSGKGGHTDEAQGVVQPQDEGAQVGAQERTDGAEDAVGQGDHDSSGSSTERRMSGECLAKNFSMGAMTAQHRMMGKMVLE